MNRYRWSPYVAKNSSWINKHKKEFMERNLSLDALALPRRRFSFFCSFQCKHKKKTKFKFFSTHFSGGEKQYIDITSSRVESSREIPKAIPSNPLSSVNGEKHSLEASSLVPPPFCVQFKFKYAERGVRLLHSSRMLRLWSTFRCSSHGQG